MAIFIQVFFSVLILKTIYAQNTKTYNEVAEFEELLKLGSPLVVLFTEECCACTNCVEAEVLIGGLSQQIEENVMADVVRLKKPDLRTRYGVKSVPTLVFIRDNKAALYDGKFDLDEVYTWLQENKEPATIDLNDETFEHLTQAATGATTGDWLVLFHDGSCCKNRELMHLENAGIKLRNRVNVASVNIRKAVQTAERFKITKCPSIIFFRHQKMYRFSLPDVTAATLRRFAEGFYKNSKAENVPFPPSPFDRFTDKIIKFYSDYWYSLLVILAVTTVATTLLLICTVLQKLHHQKSE
ncbi:uncharacterized protein LOC118201225 [Stegodyphus dumicola]|uniref:uncharacterized protein LOC118201225 n=1 Tax=Stegodyphus dumicola TaxID=202533 RepID=UPI0015A8955D|nr:uncharacterized protein LOC118201225 [Stegodyphus dumicola]